jgi:hypothetical protein
MPISVSFNITYFFSEFSLETLKTGVVFSSESLYPCNRKDNKVNLQGIEIKV